jgi:hypothetical protein
MQFDEYHGVNFFVTVTSEGKFGRIRKMAAHTAKGSISRISPFRLKRVIQNRTSHSIHNSAIHCLNRKNGKDYTNLLKILNFVCISFVNEIMKPVSNKNGICKNRTGSHLKFSELSKE